MPATGAQMKGFCNLVAYANPTITNLIYYGHGSYTSAGGWSSYYGVSYPLSGMTIFAFNVTSYINYIYTSGSAGNAGSFFTGLSPGDTFQISYVDGSGYGIYTVSSTPYLSTGGGSSWYSFNVTLVSASGTIQNTNLVISKPSYFGAGGGVTTGLLSVLTDDSNAIPIGGVMKPFLINTLGSNEPSYRVFNSIYAGTYVINRNNTVGENFYNNWSSSGTFSLFNFYNYKHWADDQRLALDIRNNSTQFAAGFRILISGFGLIFADVLNPNTPNPYPSSLVYYASLPGNSTGSYHPSSINTNFSFKIFALWDVSNPPPGSLNFNIDITDFHTGDTIYSTAGAPLTVTDTSPSIFINLSVDYWRCLNILVIIN